MQSSSSHCGLFPFVRSIMIRYHHGLPVIKLFSQAGQLVELSQVSDIVDKALISSCRQFLMKYDDLRIQKEV